MTIKVANFVCPYARATPATLFICFGLDAMPLQLYFPFENIKPSQNLHSRKYLWLNYASECTKKNGRFRFGSPRTQDKRQTRKSVHGVSSSNIKIDIGN